MIQEAIDKLDKLEANVKDGTYDRYPELLEVDTQDLREELLQVKCLIRKSFTKGEQDGRNC